MHGKYYLRNPEENALVTNLTSKIILNTHTHSHIQAHTLHMCAQIHRCKKSLSLIKHLSVWLAQEIACVPNLYAFSIKHVIIFDKLSKMILSHNNYVFIILYTFAPIF